MIRINDDWIIDVDEYNYTLKHNLHRTTNRKLKDGTVKTEEVYESVGFYSTAEKAFERLHEEIIRDRLKGASHTLETACRAIREATAEWRELMEKAVGE